MVDSIKITALQDIGANIAYTTLVPLVNMAGTPITQKSNLQNLGNLILNGAGGSYFAPAARAILTQSVTNAAQPNITSVGTLTTLAVTGNITAGNINGGNIVVANFYYGDGGFLTNVSSGSNYSNSNVAAYLPSYTGNVGADNVNVTGTVYANGISSTGLASLTVLTVSTTANLGAANNITITGGSNGQKLTTNGNGVLSWTSDANSSYGDSNVTSLLGAFGSNTITTTGNVTANYFNGVATNVVVESVNNNYSYHMAFVTGAGDTTLHMDADDNLQYNPADGLITVNRTDMQYLSVANSVLTSLVPFDSLPLDLGNATNPWQDLYLSNGTIYLGNATISANGNSIVVDSITVGGNVGTIGNIASINLDGSNANVLYGNGVFAPVAGGGNTGNVTFDNVTVQGVNGLNLSAGSDFTANLAYLQVRAGDVASHIHLDTGNNSAYDLIVGDDQNYVQVSSTGNILLSAYDSNTSQYTWTLDYNGNLILAGGNSVIQSIANSSLDILNPNVSTMVLTPDANYSSQALVLDPTSIGHIHLRSPGSNIDQPSANLFLGGETSSFEVGQFNGAVPNLFIHSNNNTWMFDIDGNLTLPQLTTISDESGIGTTLTVGAPPTVIVISGADVTAVNLTYTLAIGVTPPTWTSPVVNPASDPYIEFSNGEYGIIAPDYGLTPIYVNTGTLNIPVTQWSLNPPLGSIAPTAIYTYGAPGPDWVFRADGTLVTPVVQGGPYAPSIIPSDGALWLRGLNNASTGGVSIDIDDNIAEGTYPAGIYITSGIGANANAAGSNAATGGGVLNLQARNGGEGDGAYDGADGGNIVLSSGNGGNGTSTSSNAGPGGSVQIYGGGGGNPTVGGTGGLGGNVIISAGWTARPATPGATVYLSGGDSDDGILGNVEVYSNIGNWVFNGNSGVLTLPGGGSIYQGGANINIVSANGNVAGSLMSERSGGDLYLNSGYGVNADVDDVAGSGGDILLTAADGGETFGGNISTGGGGGNITLTAGYTYNNGTGGDVLIYGGGTDGNNRSGRVLLSAGQITGPTDNYGDVILQSNIYGWTFGPAGKGVFQSPVLAFSALPAATTLGLRAFINDANLVAAGNFGAQVGGSGANTVPVYSDGTNWRIG